MRTGECPRKSKRISRLAAAVLAAVIAGALPACGSPAPPDQPDTQAVTAAVAAGPEAAEEKEVSQAAPDSGKERDGGMAAVTITVGDKEFPALFYEGEGAEALMGQMPFTITMSELNGNEKYYNFPQDLHTGPTEQPPTLYAGEIMCWSGNCLVLFYETFSNSYGGYARIGYVEDAEGLGEALGSGSVEITFRLA